MESPPKLIRHRPVAAGLKPRFQNNRPTPQEALSSASRWVRLRATAHGRPQADALREADGSIRNIDPPGAAGGVTATSMNDAGVITGDFKSADGNYHGFIRTP